MTPRPAPAWGEAVVEELVGGRRCRVYRDRRRHVAELLTDLARWGERDCLVHGGRRITYREHLRHVNLLAAVLREAGVRRGDRVMLLASNSPEWVAVFWASFVVGAVVVPGNAWWSSDEVAHALRMVTPTVVFADARRAVLVPSATSVLTETAARQALDGDTGTDLDINGTAPAAPAEDDPAMVLFTSGTMGAAKPVLLSQRAVVANMHNLLARTRRLPPMLGPEHTGTVSLMCLPLFHIGGLQTLVSAQLSGGRLLFLSGRFDPVEVLTLIEAERVRFFGGVPTMVARVLECPRLNEFDTSSLVSVAMGGSMVVPELAARIARGFPSARRSITSVYGQTEAGGALTSANGTDLLDRPGCVGRALPVVDIRIDAPSADDVGEILARSPTVMTGFWGEDDLESPVDDHGWLHTGDLGRLDPDGYLYVVGRSREIIIRGGENIAPGHVENRLLAHPAVADVAVLGLPHPTLGEEVAAAVVVHAGAGVTESELEAFAKTALARYEIPSRWAIGSTPLPLNAAGKVAKRDLVQAWPSRPRDTRHSRYDGIERTESS